MGEAIQQVNGTTTPPAALATVSMRPSGEIVRVGFDTDRGFEALQRVGKAFASSSLVPDAYKGNIANCVIAVEMAARIGASPLMVMQNLYIVHGRPAWSAQFLISGFNSCGRFSAIRYRFTGQKNTNTWGCVAYAKELSSGETVEGTEVTIAMAKAEGWVEKKGSKWQTMPQLMLTYRAATFLIRATAPEITMGLRTTDEAYDVGPEFEQLPAAAQTPALPEAAQAEPKKSKTQQIKETLAAAKNAGEPPAEPTDATLEPGQDPPSMDRDRGVPLIDETAGEVTYMQREPGSDDA